MTKQLKEMILTALDKAGGEDYLLEQSRENPSAFMTLLGKVLPTTLAGDKVAPVQAVVSMVKIVGVRPDEKS